ncbi:tRNA pseudouridine13 synthase [Trypanosoma grayi]|uniref:tRNA pseudouridine13 synthase n=1 Tax=Trypanosoma grayi TaxID=71804 RepID=UPI0004F4AB1A|nr:tRNA pseudouridine13 synthase [Trypanosoma grayi]KEG15233.1 tRNA pseudouridine13 synthase [Trypanosoma grayi]
MEEVQLTERARDRERRIGMHFSLLDAHLAQCDTMATFERPAVSLKTLYSDFVVRELSPLYNGGAPLELETLPTVGRHDNGASSARKRRREMSTNEGEVNGARNTCGASSEVDAQQEALLDCVQLKFASLVSPEEVTSLVDSLRSGAQTVTLRSALTKEQRTQVHVAVRETLGATHISRTEAGALVIEKATSAMRREAVRRSNPIHTRKFLHFTLYKENMDSNRALRAVATSLGMSVRQLLFSGTKDKRAVTLQRVAVRGLSSEKLSEINNRSFGPECKIRVCGFKEMDVGLRLGDTLGNHFLIVLRLLPGSPEVSPDVLQTAQEVISRVGVVNYYGFQRFGTTEVLTSDVGVQLLAGEFEQALRLIFHSKAIVAPNLLPVKEALERRAFDEALRLVPHYCFQERDILKHLACCPNDFLGALRAIPRTLGMLYCHAVQSLIWNVVASDRLALSVKPLPGDLVLKSRYTCVQERESRSCGDIDDANDADAVSLLKEEGLPEVVRLTEDDVASGLFQLTDILLPVPGPDEQLQYPNIPLCTRDAYVTALTSRGAVGLMDTTNPLVKVFHYHGAYRPLVVRPKRLKIRVVDTAGPREPIIPTDLELLTGGAICNGTEKEAVPQSSSTTTPLCKAIVAEFSLPPGSYATCVLREFSTCCSEGYHAAAVPSDDGSDAPESDMDAAAREGALGDSGAV